MKEQIPSFLTQKPQPGLYQKSAGRVKTSFVNKGLETISSLLRTGFTQWETASKRGFFQGLDARVKVLFLVFFIIIVSLKKTILSEAALFLFFGGLSLASRLDLIKHYGKILFLTLVFGVLPALPAALNIFTPGEAIVTLFHFGKGLLLGPLTIPREIALTEEGLRRVMMLSLRVMNSLSISFLVLATTPFVEFIRALKVFMVPDVFLMTITLSYKTIFIFAQTVYDMHLAKKSRLPGLESDRKARQWVSSRMAFMFRKSQQQCQEVFKAMTARGLSDTVKLHRLGPVSARDWGVGLGLFLLGLLWLMI